MPYTTPHTEALHVIRNHLLVRRGEAFDLLDTGVPATVTAPSVVSRELGVRVRQLIGCAELAASPIRIDWPASSITWGASRRDALGVRVPLRMSPLGVPLISLDTHTGRAEAVLDTGAALSYCPPEFVHGLRPVRRDEDFFPGFGRFPVEIHEVAIEVMGVPLPLEAAVLPPLLRAALAMIAPDGWILGSALFRDRAVTLNLARSLAVIGASRAPFAAGDGRRGGHAAPGGAHDQEDEYDAFVDHAPGGEPVGGPDDVFDDEEEMDEPSDGDEYAGEAPKHFEHAGVAVAVAFDAATLRSGATRIRAAITLCGTQVGERDRPVELALVLDRSGSMNGEPIEAVREAACALVARLPQESQAAIVTFDDEVRVDFPLTPIGDATIVPCQRAIRGIESGGMTALAEGWRRGRSVLERALGGASRAGEVVPLRRVILMTDGRANVGERAPIALAAMCRDAAQRGISTTTMGFGDHYDEDVLRAMADAGDGSAWYMEGPDRVAEVLVEELRAMRSVGALRVALGITPEAPLTGTWGGLAGGGRTDAGDAGAARSVMVGELSAAAERTVVLEFTLPREAHPAPLQLATCELTGVAPDGVTPFGMRFPLTWDGARRTAPAVRAAWLELRLAAARERAIAMADARQFAAAAQLLARALALVDRQLPAVRERLADSRQHVAALMRRLRQGRMERGDRKFVLQHAYDRRTGKQSLFKERDW